MKKGRVRHWKSCKSGIYYYDMSGVFAEKHTVSTIGRRICFTENVKSDKRFTLCVKQINGFCLKQKLARDMLQNGRQPQQPKELDSMSYLNRINAINAVAELEATEPAPAAPDRKSVV